ncbi:hypothetical protein BKA62DRAFT_185450 [Auriculariales sp. MPI-PUGE-AT-0066]|nr:hypothetical protein BKA62DRAFT_185450 [Auriculariales sp. MPI-PUGE-AT-0066]
MSRSPDAVSLPFELLAHIFSFACYADARLPQTLSVLSSLCRELAEPLLYRSLFIHGPAHLHAVLRQLRRHPHRINLILHVALTDHFHATRLDTPGHPDIEKGKYRNLTLRHSARPDNPAYTDSFMSDVQEFLDMVSPTLQSLYVATYNRTAYERTLHQEVFSRTYPVLKELGYRGVSGRDDEGAWLVRDRKQFPWLERIWLSSGDQSRYYPGRGAKLPHTLRQHCPRLTHVRLFEPGRELTNDLLADFIAWHGVQLVTADEEGYAYNDNDNDSDYGYSQGSAVVDMTAVLWTNPLLGFPKLKQLIVDARPTTNADAWKTLCDIATRRFDVVALDSSSKCRQRAPLQVFRETWQAGVSGELWKPENVHFDAEASERWAPILVQKGRRNNDFRGRGKIVLPSSSSDNWLAHTRNWGDANDDGDSFQ